MPNQRKKGQKLIGAFVREETHKRMKAEAKRLGVTVSELVRRLLEEKNGEGKKD
jgi:hypothetical protein